MLDGSGLAGRYAPNPAFHDEMALATGSVRKHWRAFVDSLTAIGPDGLASRWQEGRRLIYDNGISYNVYSDPKSTDRPWPLDPIPLLIDPREWETIADAMRQRATLLNAIIADLYGPQQLLRA